MVDILEKTIEAQQKQIEELTFGRPQESPLQNILRIIPVSFPHYWV